MANVFQIARNFTGVVVLLAVAACAGPETAGGIYDPYEMQNREVHEGNRQLDQVLVRPASNAYGEVLPEPVRIGVSNFASNLAVPGTVVNDLLQLNLGDALHNTARFLLNTTVGLGGFLDPAKEAGIEARESDFGETLHVWGFKEGPYLELLVLGPSTSRDAVGKFVDIFLDPLGQVIPAPERYALPVASVAARMGDRYRFSGTVDSILYDSADSYAQARLLYLENRRFELGTVVSEADDLYEGLYDDFE